MASLDDTIKSLQDLISKFEGLPQPTTAPTTLDGLKSFITALKSEAVVLGQMSTDVDDIVGAMDDQKLLEIDPTALDSVVHPDAAADAFQGIRFYDGTAFGFLRVFADRVELVLNENQEDESVSYALDGTIPHTYRITGSGKDVQLYVDGVLAIDGSGQFISSTAEKIIEFGDISGFNKTTGSKWETFKYSTTGAFPPATDSGRDLEEIMYLPGGAIGTMKSYRDNLYVSHDPFDAEQSSKIYKFKEGGATGRRSTIAVTKSNVRAVVVDPNRTGNAFETSGKYIGTDRGLQYVVGGKPYPWELLTTMAALPELSGKWAADTNCDGFCRSAFNDILTIDTTQEVGHKYMRYAQNKEGTVWVDGADNEKGWTIEARVRVMNDGTGALEEDSAIDAAVAADAKDVVFAIEESSLMTPPERDIAKAMVSSFLQSLGRSDRFGLLFYRYFNTEDFPVENLSRRFSTQLEDATQDNIASAIEFLEGMSPAAEANWLPDVLSGTESALAYDFENTNRFVVVVGTGFSYYGPRDVTDMSSTTVGTPPVDIGINGQSVTNNTNATNTGGPNATIVTVAVGSMLDNPEPKLTVSIGGQTYVYDNFGASEYQNMMSLLATDSGGEAFRANAYDDVSTISTSVWRSIDPAFVTPTSGSPKDGTLDPTSASIIGGGEGCLPGQVQSRTQPGTLPDEDGLNAPGILINDGTYQEVVSFFQSGVRLKYAKIFAKQTLSDQFYDVRVIGKRKAIAVFVRGDNEKDWHRLIYAPEALSVRSQESGNEELPSTAVDAFGNIHAVWQESKAGGEWRIHHTKTKPKKILAEGAGLYSPANLPEWNMLSGRAGFGGAPTTGDLSSITDASDVLIATSASFKSVGAKRGDFLLVYDSAAVGDAAPAVPRRFTIKNVLDEIYVQVDTSDNLNALYSAAHYQVISAADGYELLPPSMVDSQGMDSYFPIAFVHSGGNVFVAYSNNESGTSDIYLARGVNGVNSINWKTTAKVTDSMFGAIKPSLAEMKDGSLFLTWEERTSSATEIRYAVVPIQEGDMMPGKPRILTSDPTNPKSPKAGVVNDIPFVVYEEIVGTASKIYMIELSETADSLGSPVELSNGLGGNSKNPTVVTQTTPAPGVTIHRAFVAWENDETGISEIVSCNYTVSEATPVAPPPPEPKEIGGGGGGSTSASTFAHCDITPPPLRLYFTNTPADYVPNAVESLYLGNGSGSDFVAYQLSTTPQAGTLVWNTGGNRCGVPSPTTNGNTCPKSPAIVWVYTVSGPTEIYIPGGEHSIGIFFQSVVNTLPNTDPLSGRIELTDTLLTIPKKTLTLNNRASVEGFFNLGGGTGNISLFLPTGMPAGSTIGGGPGGSAGANAIPPYNPVFMSNQTCGKLTLQPGIVNFDLVVFVLRAPNANLPLDAVIDLTNSYLILGGHP